MQTKDMFPSIEQLGGNNSGPDPSNAPTVTPNPFGSSFASPAFPSSGARPASGTLTSPLFGAPSTPPFATSTTPSLFASSSPLFGASSTTPSLFGSTSPLFGASSTTPSLFASCSPFSPSSNAAFGSPFSASSTTPAFGACITTPASNARHSPLLFGACTGTTNPRIAFNSSAKPEFGWDSSPFGGFRYHCSGAPSFSHGGDPSFPSATAKSGFQIGGSRVVAYKPTHDHYECQNSGMQHVPKIDSISAMPAYNDMSHEELKWIDYCHGNKGGSNNSGDVIRSVNTESDKISINIEIPSRVATQLLDSLKSIWLKD